MASRLKPAVSNKDHMQGNENAPLELVEYGDYQCPHCGRAYPIIKEVQKTIGENLKFVLGISHYPMHILMPLRPQ